MAQFNTLDVMRSFLIGLTAACLGGMAAHAGSDNATNHGSTATEPKASAAVATIGGLDHTAQTPDQANHTGSKPHWAYEGALGPDKWGGLSAEFSMCSHGAMQSPINFSDTFGAGGAPIEFDYYVAPMNVVNNGHTVQFNYEPGSSITVDGKRYELLQFHFHTPSEHAIASRQSAMEMHLVHKNAEGQLAVVGVMMDIGGTSRALNEIWAHMPAAAGQTYKQADVLVNARDLLPKSRNYYRYMGSLTTPPCSEGVNWFVLDTPVTVGIEQVKRLADSVGFNARPLQPKKKRLVIAPIHTNH